MRRQKATLISFSALAIALICVFHLSSNPIALGQEIFGEFTGVVTDSTGSAVGDASVTIINKLTGREFATKTSSAGVYIARDIEPGHYKVRIEMPGFSPAEVADVNLLLGKKLNVDASLEVAPVEQAVTVIAATPLIDLSSTATSHNVTAEEFDRLPKTRSFQALAMTSPSVNSGEIEGGIQVNGASAFESQFTIDGISTNSVLTGGTRQDAAFEFLQEVQVKTGGLQAQYGGALGGVISAVTKSGGNSFHGDVHYYYAGNAISAGPVRRLLLDPLSQRSASYVQDDKGKDNRHEVGGSLGGYLIRNKLWFFTSASPRWIRKSNQYLFGSTTAAGTIDQKQLNMQSFAKVSLDLTQRVRANVAWLYTPKVSTGLLPAYDYSGNMLTTNLASNSINRNIGFFAPQSSYTGNIDFVLNNKSLLTARGGYFWDNYKTTGVPTITAVSYSTSATNLPFDIPQDLKQPAGFQNAPRIFNTSHDLTTRAFVQLDYRTSAEFLGRHDLILGFGTQKSVENVLTKYPGGGYAVISWDRSFTSNATGLTQRGIYGYYEFHYAANQGSGSGNITNLYVHDTWRVRPRLTLSLGLRAEQEKIPSYRRDIKDFGFEFGFADKLAPRIGASLDVLGNGKLKMEGSWGRFFDWTKFATFQGLFGGGVSISWYRALDTTDVFSLSGTNTPGRNLWSDDPNSFRDFKVPVFNTVDPNLKPLSSDSLNFGLEYQLNRVTVLSARYVHSGLRRTVEDLGALLNGNVVSRLGNPGEGIAKVFPPSGATQPFPTPKPVRTYDALELEWTRRFSGGWFGSASYVYSRLYGNYAGLGNSDEIKTPTNGTGISTSQQQDAPIYRYGTNGTRDWDLDEILWDSHGNLNVLGRLATDRPHVMKFYGSRSFKAGTELGAFFYGGSGTPLSTYVNTINNIKAFVNGRGDMGRTPFLTQTDLVVSHELKVSEGKRLRFEFNALNLFNQKTARHLFNDLNRAVQSSQIDLHNVDLSKGYDYKALIEKTSDQVSGKGAYDPRYGMDDLFNPGLAGRLGIKFVF